MNKPSKAILECLAHGLYDLNKGDLSDRATADQVEIEMLKEHDLILQHGEWVPSAEATHGYVFRNNDGVYVSRCNGVWHDPDGVPLTKGSVVFFDYGCAHSIATA